MTLTYQQEQLLQAVTGRAAILDLDARHNRAYSDGDRERWIATFRHSGASYTRDSEQFTDLRGGDGSLPSSSRPTRRHRLRVLR